MQEVYYDERGHKYKVYRGENKVITVTTYAGKPVRGVAVCHPDDEYDFSAGVALAAKRCRVKIAKLRQNRATDSLSKIVDEYAIINRKYRNALKYVNTSNSELEEAEKDLKDTLNKM